MHAFLLHVADGKRNSHTMCSMFGHYKMRDLGGTGQLIVRSVSHSPLRGTYRMKHVSRLMALSSESLGSSLSKGTRPAIFSPRL
jgi:hypothetical protein